MRDERGHERISIQLAPRQITTLIVVSLALLGGLFAGGYFMGRQHAQETVAMGPALSGLAAIDAEDPAGAAPESTEPRATPTALGEVEFMFPSALGSRPGRKVKRPQPVRLAEAHVGVQGAAPAVADTPKAEPKVERPEPKVVKKPKPKPRRVVEARPKRPAKATPAARKRVAPSLPPASMARLDNPTRPARPAVAAPALPVAPVPARLARDEDAPARRPAPTRSTRRYTVQLKSAHAQDNAETFAAMIRRKGYAPRVVLAQIPGKGTLYRVRVGEFGSRAEARRFQRTFRSKTGHADAGFITEL